jgi:hypothetical protein
MTAPQDRSPDRSHDAPVGAKGYEERDVAIRPIVVTAVFLVILIVVSLGLVWWLDTALGRRDAARSASASPLAASYGQQEPPAPRLQENPRRDLATLRARDEELLETYGWVDRSAGRVRIPVEQAMELLADKGGR